MSKLITLFCFLSTLFCSYAVAAESVTEYPYSENFDNTAEKEMPSGWAVEGESPFAVYPAFDWYGVQAQSGANALVSGYPQTGNRTDVAYSPMFEMKAGVEYTMTVWVKMRNTAQNGRNPIMKVTVGTAQASDAHTVELTKQEGECDWTEVKVTYTPEADGQYCFGLWCCSVLTTAGDVYFDTFSVSEGESAAAGNVAELPYAESFDTTADEEMPAGWAVAGETPFAVYQTFDWYGVQA